MAAAKAAKSAGKRGGKVNLRPSAKKEAVTRIPKMVDTKVMGLEPVVDGVVFQDNDVRLSACYNWYNYFYDTAESKKYALEHYLKHDAEMAKRLQKVPDAMFSTTVGWICRMLDRGGELPAKTLLWRSKRIREMLDNVQEIKETKVAVKAATGPSYKAPGYNANIEYVEMMIDNFFTDDYATTFVMYDYLSKNDIKKTYATAIAEYYRPLLDEVKLLVRGKDKDLNEGYSTLSKKQKDAYLKFIFSIVEDCERWSANKTKTSRVARAPRKKSAEQLLKYFKYKKDNAALKVVSIDPASIIGATTLVAFNDKYKKVMIFTAKPGETLSVKGASISGYDETAAVAKTLRKPEQQLQAFTNGTLAFMKKRFDEVKAVTSSPSARISTDVLLLKVFK